MDTADWDEAVIGLGQSASDVQLLGRLLDVDEHLAIWRERGAAFRAPWLQTPSTRRSVFSKSWRAVKQHGWPRRLRASWLFFRRRSNSADAPKSGR